MREKTVEVITHRAKSQSAGTKDPGKFDNGHSLGAIFQFRYRRLLGAQRLSERRLRNPRVLPPFSDEPSEGKAEVVHENPFPVAVYTHI